MLDFLIVLWLVIALIIEIPKLIQEFKDLIRMAKGDIREEDIDKFILKQEELIMSEKIAKILTVNAILNIIILITYLIYCIIDMDNYDTKQGIVVDKQYSTETAYTEYITNSGDKMPYQKYIAEKYKIEIQKTVNGKQKKYLD